MEFKQNGSAKQLSHGTKSHHYSYRNIIRKHSHSLNKYRRIDLGNCVFFTSCIHPEVQLKSKTIQAKSILFEMFALNAIEK